MAPKGRTIPKRRYSLKAALWDGFNPIYILSLKSRRECAVLTRLYSSWISPTENEEETKCAKNTEASFWRQRCRVEVGPRRIRYSPSWDCCKNDRRIMAIWSRYSIGMKAEYQKWRAISAAWASSATFPRMRSKTMLRQTIGRLISLMRMLRLPE